MAPLFCSFEGLGGTLRPGKDLWPLFPPFAKYIQINTKYPDTHICPFLFILTYTYLFIPIHTHSPIHTYLYIPIHIQNITIHTHTNT